MLTNQSLLFRSGILLFCLSYLTFQLLYIPYPALTADELWFAHHIYQYTEALPYRDFLPYKTVLGYYLFSAPFFFSHDAIAPLNYIRDEIALINTFFMAGIAFYCRRFFMPKAILLALILIAASQLFLIYSVDLRVDMLTAWLGLVSILLVLSHRYGWAGILLGLSFCVSQKALWFFIATNVAFLIDGLYVCSHWLQKRSAIQAELKKIAFFNLSTLLVVAAYIAFWSYFSDVNTVLHSVFYEAYTQSKIDWYSKVYYDCWQVILENGPLLFLLWPLTFIGLIKDKNQTRRIFILVYASVILLFAIRYQQAFPYNMVFVVPAFFVLYAEFFSWLSHCAITGSSVPSERNRLSFWFISLCTIAIMSLSIATGLSYGYFLSALIPAFLGLFFYYRHRQPDISSLFYKLVFITLFFVGILFPLTRFSIVALKLDGEYQKSMIRLASALLQEKNTTFFAGMPLVYNKNQSVLGLKNLIGPAIEYLYAPSNELLPIMISSLYLDPRTQEQVINDLKNHPVTFYVDTSRIESLPLAIQKNLFSQYEQSQGSIYLYSPRVKPTQSTMNLAFTGQYQLKTSSKKIIYIDHKPYHANALITLSAGTHQTHSRTPYRLKWMPSNQMLSDENSNEWYRMMRAITL